MAPVVQQPVTRCIHITNVTVNAAGVSVSQFLTQGSYSVKYHVKQPSEKRWQEDEIKNTSQNK